MKKILIAFLFAVLPGLGLAAGSSVPLEPANVDIDNKASLQRGAKVFTEYCLSCHSAKFVRFNRMAADLGLTDEQVMDNLNHVTDKVGNTMEVAMTKDYGKQAFGKAPPDLSLIARSRGSDWLYTYLISFYADPLKPTGMNNVVFKDVGMPNVMWELQGIQKAVEHDDGQGHKTTTLELVEPGTMTEAEFKATVRDLVAFLTWAGEPVQTERKRLGVWVLMFLFVFFLISYYMKKEFWKDIKH